MIRENRLSEIKYKMLSGEKVEIVCFGDSVTAGQTGTVKYSEYLQDILRRIYHNDRINLSNFGKGGQTSKVGTTVIQEKITVPNQYDLAFVMYGINDTSTAVRSYTIQEHKEYMEQCISHLIEHGIEVILMSSSITYGYEDQGMQHGGYAGFIRRRIKSMGLADVELAKKYNLMHIDMAEEINAVVNAMFYSYRDLFNDGAHFKNTGYKLIADIVAKKLDWFCFRNDRCKNQRVQLTKSIYTIHEKMDMEEDDSVTGIHFKMKKGDRLYFDFINEVYGARLELYGMKARDGAKLVVWLDENPEMVDFSGDETEAMACAYDQLGYGYHRLVIDCMEMADETYAYPNYVKLVNE
ncbi:MAG: SGNH/GDSL hydrolase family protein [Lachnospiraceae bacterium]|nr:SGNH/GDSL hydrolase family protein [Lachnospiraceae bacterium]